MLSSSSSSLRQCCFNTTLFYLLLFTVVTTVVDSQVHKQNIDPNIDYTELGNNTWWRFRPAWSLKVNDQCLYEFVFQFEHDESLPVGDKAFEGICSFKNPATQLPYVADEDNEYYLKPRKFYERFPPYVWATIGFNHLSVDWYPCGKRPFGYALPSYGFSFFRVTPEYRATTMVCEKADTTKREVVPGLDDVCHDNPTDIKGKNFFIKPGALINRKPIVNSPETFTQLFPSSPISSVGLRAMDETIVPDFANQWNDIVMYTSTYGGNLVNWEAHIPYRLVTGEQDIFTSAAARYYESTIQTLPDTVAYDYDESDGVIRFIMVGKSNLCRSEFDNAERASSGPPIFPNYDIDTDSYDPENVDGDITTGSVGDSSDDSNNNGRDRGRGSSSTIRTTALSFAILFGLLFLQQFCCW